METFLFLAFKSRYLNELGRVYTCNNAEKNLILENANANFKNTLSTIMDLKKYYIHNGIKQEGPFNLEDLKTKNITPNSYVWFEGISDWITAGEINELKELFFISTPPQFSKPLPSPIIQNKAKITESTKTSKPMKKNWIWSYFRKVILTLIAIYIGFLIIQYYQSKDENTSASPSESYLEKVMTIEEIEKSQPLKFLDASGNYNSNFWGTKLKVHGVITNSATIAIYKDAVVEITYYSKTDTELGSKQYTIYDHFPPHSTVNFELKIENYKEVSKIGWKVIEAIAE